MRIENTERKKLIVVGMMNREHLLFRCNEAIINLCPRIERERGVEYPWPQWNWNNVDRLERINLATDYQKEFHDCRSHFPCLLQTQ